MSKINQFEQNPLHSLPFHRKRNRKENDITITEQKLYPYSYGEEILHLMKTQEIIWIFQDPENWTADYLYKVHSIEALILNYKEKREEERDKWIPFSERRGKAFKNYPSRARPYSWTEISHEGSETLSLGQTAIQTAQKKERKKKTGEEERSDFSRNSSSDISHIYNGGVIFLSCVTVGWYFLMLVCSCALRDWEF